MSTGAVIVLVAGGATFTNKWYQTRQADWKVPVATLLLAGGIEAISSVDKNAGTVTALLVLLGAVTTKFNGHSAIDTITALSASHQSSKPSSPQPNKKKV